ncbi:MAG: hypothetical protein K1X89_23650 [Myxococcaceae bacterium]|nr:hypothetical protein [Myxococcaceae bacterium]
MRRLALLAVLPLLACGSPKEGDKCDTIGFLCLDSANAMECYGSKWVKLPCKGTNGCKRENDIVRCDMSGNVAGDNCASTAVSRGLCTADGKGTLECRENGAGEPLTLQKTLDCRTCMVNGDQVVCTPP